MNKVYITSATLHGFMLALGLFILGLLVTDSVQSYKALERVVTVKGLSEREVPADIVIWPLTFQIADNDLTNLFDTIQGRLKTIRSFLSQYGIKPEDMTVSPPAVTDLHAQNYGDVNRVKFRYTGRSTLTVYSRDVASVKKAMANVIELGRQGVAISAQEYNQRTEFLFTGLNKIKPDMIEEATRNARDVAGKFAADSDSKLGKIKAASQGQFSINDRDATTPHIKKVRVVSTVQYYLTD